MLIKKIQNNLYLGNQFSNTINALYQLKISNIYYDILLNQKVEEIQFFNQGNFIKTKTKLALNLLDSHDVDDFKEVIFASAVKFIDENIFKSKIYTHCQLGISRSASAVFVYLTIKNQIKCKTFQEALNEFIENFYPHMKLNFGVFQFLKNNFPFNKIKLMASKSWKELECII